MASSGGCGGGGISAPAFAQDVAPPTGRKGGGTGRCGGGRHGNDAGAGEEEPSGTRRQWGDLGARVCSDVATRTRRTSGLGKLPPVGGTAASSRRCAAAMMSVTVNAVDGGRRSGGSGGCRGKESGMRRVARLRQKEASKIRNDAVVRCVRVPRERSHLARGDRGADRAPT